MRLVPLLVLLFATAAVSVTSDTSIPIAPLPQASASASPWFPLYSSTGSGSASSSGSSVPDRGTYWPWNTPRGVLPPSTKLTSLNPLAQTNLCHVIWQTAFPTNTTTVVPVPAPGYLASYDSTAQHTYFRAIFPDVYTATQWATHDLDRTQVNAIVIAYGLIYSTYTAITTSLPRLLLRYSYLLKDNQIPSLPLAQYTPNMYYVTARSSMGEFRMITYTNSFDATTAYATITQEFTTVQNNSTQTSQRAWDTVKVYGPAGPGNVLLSSTTSRGSELEHQAVFQWCSLPLRLNRVSDSYTYYMLVSFTSLSGLRLERMHTYSDSATAQAAQAWVSWYTNSYDNYYQRASVMIYYRQQIVYSIMNNYYDYNQLQQDYSWVVKGSPTPYPYPYPYPYPNYPPQSQWRTSTAWSDLTRGQFTFIIVYPTSLIVAALLILLIVRCCVKRRVDNLVVPTPVPPCLHRLTCLMLLLSVGSFVLLIVSISLKRFSNAWVNYGTTSIASYGPFQVDQGNDYYEWLSLRKTAQVMSPVTGTCMLISMFASCALISRVKSNILTFHVVFLTLVAFLFSLCATLVWIPVHVRLQDHGLDAAVLQQYNTNNGGGLMAYHNNINMQVDGYYGYGYYKLLRSMGVGYILLMCATGIHFMIFMLCVIVHKKYAHRNTTPEHDLEGLQLVEPTSPYYYRDVPANSNPAAMMAVPFPAYVPPTTAPPTAPPFMFAAVPASTGYAYAAPIYHPPPPVPVAEPVHQPISAPTSHTGAAPAALAPTAAYPSLPVDVPASGPSNTGYQRLL